METAWPIRVVGRRVNDTSESEPHQAFGDEIVSYKSSDFQAAQAGTHTVNFCDDSHR